MINAQVDRISTAAARSFAIGSVLAAEAINTAIEKLADFISPSHQVLIGKAKDLAAAVLILYTCAFIIGGIIFIPKIIHF